jgi:hypothetical protein
MRGHGGYMGMDIPHALDWDFASYDNQWPLKDFNVA